MPVKTVAPRAAVTTPKPNIAPRKPTTAPQHPVNIVPAGWGTAPKQTTLKMVSSQITRDYGMEKGFAAPKGAKVATKSVKHKETMSVPGGKKAHLDVSAQQVTVTLANGKKVSLTPDLDKNMKAVVADFKANFKGLTKEEMQYTMLGWYDDSGVSGFGNAGQLMSVVASNSSDTGGAHPNNYSSLVTMDLRTGKPAKLSDLLSKEQFKSITDAIAKKLPTLKGTGEEMEGIDGNTFGADSMTAKDIADTAASNFALTTDKNGKVSISIGWESGVHALGPAMAMFTFDAPTDNAFKAKIGQ